VEERDLSCARRALSALARGPVRLRPAAEALRRRIASR
jgi:DNA/RNA-binding domain of Phe-tRNA-synthetase-like protein